MAYERESKEAIALKSLQSKRYPDANKDFMKNMRRLNSAVDYISGTLGQMQKGIDDANKNFIEQIQDFIADLIVVFAGGEPTGIELGDLKYILQALGALFGLNGPFPLSLIEAAFNFFFGFVVPMEQFTDLIFDTIFAWAEDFGLDPEFIQELQELAAAFGDISETIVDLFESLTNLLDIFGIFSGDFGPFGILWNAIFGLFDGIDTSGFSSILDLVTGVMTPFIDALTFIIEIVDSILEAFAGGIAEVAGILNFAKMWAIFDFTQPNWNPIAAAIEWVESVIGGAISALFGDHIPLGAISNKDKNFFSNPTFDPTLGLYGWEQTGTAWTLDETTTHESSGGSAKVTANGTQRILKGVMMSVEEGQEVFVQTYVKWDALTATGTPIKVVIEGYAKNVVAFTQTVVSLTAPLGAASDWVELAGSHIVPEPTDKAIDSVRAFYIVESTATAGTIHFSNNLMTKRIKKGFFGIDLIGGLSDVLQGVDSFVQEVIGYITEAITGIFGDTSSLDDFFDTVWGWVEDGLAAAAQAADSWFGLKDLIDAMLSGWQQTDPNTTGWGTLPILELIFNLGTSKAKELSNIKAGLEALRADQAGNNNSGNTFVIDVSQYAGIPTGFTNFYSSGSMTITNDGDTLEPSHNNGVKLYISDQPLMTAQQEISGISPREAVDYFGSYSGRYIYYICRANHPTAPTSFTFIRISRNRVRVGCVKAGAVGAGSSFTNPYWFGVETAITWDEYMTLRAGAPGDDGIFQVIINNKVREAFEDLSNFSDITGKHWGFGFENTVVDGVNRSLNLALVAANDNTPPATPGVGVTIRRLNPVAVNMASAAAGSGYEMTNVFDDVKAISPHFEIVDLARGHIKVLKDMWLNYIFHAEVVTPFLSTNVSAPPHHVMAYIRVTPAVGSPYDGPRGIPASSARDGFANALGVPALVLIYAGEFKAGDILEPRFNIGSTLISNQWVGDAGGQKTYISIAQSNWNTS